MGGLQIKVPNVKYVTLFVQNKQNEKERFHTIYANGGKTMSTATGRACAKWRRK